jgi:hypothetical protein
MSAGPRVPTASGGPPQDAFPELPTFHLFSEEELKRDFTWLKIRPLDDPGLACGLGVPNDWESVPLTIPQAALTRDAFEPIPLFLINAPAPEVSVQLAYVRVPEIIEVQAWAEEYLRGNALTLRCAQQADFSGRPVFDTLVRGKDEVWMRVTFWRRGDRIFLQAGFCPRDLYLKYARVLGLAAVSLRFEQEKV